MFDEMEERSIDGIHALCWKEEYGEGKPSSNNFLFYKRWSSSALNSLSIILLKIIAYDKQMIEIFPSALLLS